MMNSSQVEGNGTQEEEQEVPFQIYIFQAVAHPIALVICVPMNVIVAYVIVSDRSLHNARNAIWLGIIISNLMVFFMMSLQYFIFVEQSYAVCQLASFLIGKPYVVLLINILLATVDRIIYTRWPLFHQSHVTVARVVIVQFACSASAFVALGLNFMAESTPIRCGWNPQNAKITIGVVSALNFSCITAKLTVYFMATKKKFVKKIGATVKRATAIESDSQTKIIVREISRLSLRVHCGSRKFRLMEWNATMTLVANLIPMMLFASLAYLYLLSQLLCRSFFGDCETLNHLEVYFRELGIFHVCTDLLVYVCRSQEFRSAVRKLLPASRRAQVDRTAC